MMNINKTVNENNVVCVLKDFFEKEGERAWLVGGFLRDCLLGRESCDVDVTVEKGKAGTLAKRFADSIVGYFIELDEVNNIYRVVFEDKVNYVDFADCVGDSIEQDLKRRDFTVNALGYDLVEEVLIDTVAGVNDLKSGVIREISEQNIIDDPIRILRAFRFQSALGFELSENLENIIKEHAHLLANPAKERVNAELLKLFDGKKVVEALRAMDSYGLLEMIFSPIKEMKKVPKNSHHHLNLFEHSLETVKQMQCFYDESCEEVKEHLDSSLGACSRLCLLKLGAFLHDVGKPATWQIDENGRHRFIKHDTEGALLIAPVLRELKFSKKQIAYVQKIIKNHIYPAGVVTSDEATERAYLRFYRKMGDEVIDLIAIAHADRMSALGPEITEEMLSKNIEGLKSLLVRYLDEKNKMAPLPKLIDGHEVMEMFNLEAGRKLGEVLEALKEAQISGEVSTKQEAEDFLRRLIG